MSCVTPTGRIIVAFDESTGDGVALGTVAVIYSDNGGMTWSSVANPLVTPTGSNYKGASSLVCTASGTIILTILYSNASDSYEQLWYVTSTNNGASWGTETQYSVGFTAFNYARGDALYTANGTVLIPNCGLNTGDTVTATNYRPGVLRSTDGGSTFALIQIGGELGVAEMSLVQLTNGKVFAMMRQDTLTSTSNFYTSTSTDNGATWSTPVSLTAFNVYPGKPSLCYYNGSMVLVYRELTTEYASFRTSIDGGVTWSAATTLLSNIYAYACMVNYGTDVVGCVAYETTASIATVDLFRMKIGYTVPSLAVTTSGTSPTEKIQIQTSNFAQSTGDQWNFYQATGAATSGVVTDIGEGGCAEWYHGPYSTSTNLTGFTVANYDGGLFIWGGNTGHGDVSVACTGTGSAFTVANAANTAYQSVHLLASTSTTQAETFWNMWANGTAVVCKKNNAGASFRVYIETTCLTAAESTHIYNTSQVNAGYGGYAMAYTVNPYKTASPDNTDFNTSGVEGALTVSYTSSTTLGSGYINSYRLLMDGYEGQMSSALAKAQALDYQLHSSGASNGLTVTTGTAPATLTDPYGNTFTSADTFWDQFVGAWRIVAASVAVNCGGNAAAWGIDGSNVSTRYKPCFIITGWAGSVAPSLTFNGVALVAGVDFGWYFDGTSTLYISLSFDISSGMSYPSAIGALAMAQGVGTSNMLLLQVA